MEDGRPVVGVGPALVGTRNSNWNRLIDELRCVWVDKCHHPYVEVGDEPAGSYGW